MDKLTEFIKDGKFPITRTGISNNDFIIQKWKRIQENLTYTCSLCGCDIPPTAWLGVHIQRGYTVPRESIFGIRHESEVLGYICTKCDDEISDYDNLHYG